MQLLIILLEKNSLANIFSHILERTKRNKTTKVTINDIYCHYILKYVSFNVRFEYYTIQTEISAYFIILSCSRLFSIFTIRLQENLVYRLFPAVISECLG